ncbi:N-acetyltransferase [Piscinibacter sp. XHJ-5]|uniref:N-acetyltransferase n=1 Tax=Piscinibacter sp. XHJ-5 TaxID=3037797 RepID=UPI00245330F2|nr:N-acetyltransferase [Piscinibacter sp. XHJ-5]
MTDIPYSVHPLSDVQTTEIGAGTRIWQYVVVLPGARIGRECNICSHCFIESEVSIGDRVTIKSGVQVWNGITLEDGVMVGPNVSFTNDRHPRSGNRGFRLERTVVARDASIGAGAVLLPGLRIGAGATVGAGAVVTRDVPDGATVVGNPARIIGEAQP